MVKCRAPDCSARQHSISRSHFCTVVCRRSSDKASACLPASEPVQRTLRTQGVCFASNVMTCIVLQALSCLSEYFHFGQLSSQRSALEATKHKSTDRDAVEGFLEESVVRKELSDNFCFYEPDYDKIKCASGWAIETLKKHAKDKREYTYTWCAMAFLCSCAVHE